MKAKPKITRITILNGDPSAPDSEFTARLFEYCKHLAIRKCEFDIYHLSNMNIQHCSGCWNCWLKTPGKCSIQDDTPEIFKSITQSDLLIFASPMRAGFTSSVLKKFHDRLVSLIHPYMKIMNGELHHRKRYDTYPEIGVLVSAEHDTDNEDLIITEKIYDRFAINFHSHKSFFYNLDIKNTEEIADETCCF